MALALTLGANDPATAAATMSQSVPAAGSSSTRHMAVGGVRPSAAFDWSVTPHVVTRRFDPPEEPWGSGHRGVDLRSVPGAKVTAPADGIVTFSGVIAGRGVLTLRHPEGFDTTYEPVSDRIPKGTSVKRGQRIATLDAGHCDPACLHWGYKTGHDTYRDPLTLVRTVKPILLPPV